MPIKLVIFWQFSMCDLLNHKTIQSFLTTCYFRVTKLNLTMTFSKFIFNPPKNENLFRSRPDLQFEFHGVHVQPDYRIGWSIWISIFCGHPNSPSHTELMISESDVLTEYQDYVLTHVSHRDLNQFLIKDHQIKKALLGISVTFLKDHTARY